MSRPALLVCEPTGRWAAALRRASADEPLRIVETRRPAEVLARLAEAPECLVAVAWSAERRDEAGEMVDAIGRRYPKACVVVLLDRHQTDEAALASELGAVQVCCGRGEVPAVVRLARRHLGRHAASRHWAAMAELVESIWQTLPLES